MSPIGTVQASQWRGTTCRPLVSVAGSPVAVIEISAGRRVHVHALPGHCLGRAPSFFAKRCGTCTLQDRTDGWPLSFLRQRLGKELRLQGGHIAARGTTLATPRTLHVSHWDILSHASNSSPSSAVAMGQEASRKRDARAESLLFRLLRARQTVKVPDTSLFELVESLPEMFVSSMVTLPPVTRSSPPPLPAPALPGIPEPPGKA
jgi:hypothetical protein